MVDEILNEFNLKGKKNLLEKGMKKYGFVNKIKEMNDRLDKYESIVYGEMEF